MWNGSSRWLRSASAFCLSLFLSFFLRASALFPCGTFFADKAEKMKMNVAYPTWFSKYTLKLFSK